MKSRQPYGLFRSLRWILIILMAMTALFLGSCSQRLTQLKPPITVTYAEEVVLDARLQSLFYRYWAHRLAGLSDQAFELEAPYFQDAANRMRYAEYTKQASGVDMVDIKVREVNKKTDHLYQIHCRFRYKMNGGGEKDWFIIDRWVKVEDRWYHVVYDPILFPLLS